MSTSFAVHVQLESSISLAWSVRASLDPASNYAINSHPVIYAMWLATFSKHLELPPCFQDEIEKSKAEPVSVAQAAEFVTQNGLIQRNITNPAFLIEAIHCKATFSVHKKNPEILNDFFKNAMESFEKRENLADSQFQSFTMNNFIKLCSALKFTALETEILYFAMCMTVQDDLRVLFENLDSASNNKTKFWSSIFACSVEEMHNALAPSSALTRSGLLEKNNATIPQMSMGWIEKISHNSTLLDALLEEHKASINGGMPAQLFYEDMNIVCRLLANDTKEQGVNVLLYSENNLNKDELLLKIKDQSNVKLYSLNLKDLRPSDYLSATCIANTLLSANSNERSVLIVDKPSEILRPVHREMMMFFGIASFEDACPMEEVVLTQNKVPTLWTNLSKMPINPEVLANFIFHAPLHRASKKERIELMSKMIGDTKISEESRDKILRMDGVSERQFFNALRVADMLTPKQKTLEDPADHLEKIREDYIISNIKRSQKAMGREIKGKFAPTVTKYSLDLINTSGPFTPSEIVSSLRRNPKGSILLYGMPGTGKTTFVEHIASELGMGLVSKTASDLLSKYIGESEQNIAKAFQEASDQESILFIDEADSFLRSRSEARDSHEVSKVNEMLQQIERFDGVVMISTNLFKKLDAAVLRRFSFKLEFLPLQEDQRWTMFVNESGFNEIEGQFSLNDLANSNSSIDKNSQVYKYREAISKMKSLCAGDFATVKRQCLILNKTLTPDQWIEQLQAEVRIKEAAPEL